jgi:ribosomal-protein-alanine N-acetyltransferase
MSIILETSRLTLREFVSEDAAALSRVISDPETMKYYPAPFDLPGVDAWIARNLARYEKDGTGLWAMILKKSGELIGDCGIIHQDVEGEIIPEIGYHLRRDCWGHGYATEAALACKEWAFTNLKTERVISLIRPENLPSRRVAERNGMTIWKDIQWRELRHYVYAITKADASKG